MMCHRYRYHRQPIKVSGMLGDVFVFVVRVDPLYSLSLPLFALLTRF